MVFLSGKGASDGSQNYYVASHDPGVVDESQIPKLLLKFLRFDGVNKYKKVLYLSRCQAFVAREGSTS